MLGIKSSLNLKSKVLYCNTLFTCFSNFYKSLDNYARVSILFSSAYIHFWEEWKSITTHFKRLKSFWNNARSKIWAWFFFIFKICWTVCIFASWICLLIPDALSPYMLTSLSAELLRKTEFSLISHVLDMKHNLYRKKS